MLLSELGNRIRSQRERLGLKQQDIANALQISPQAVSKWERGKTDRTSQFWEILRDCLECPQIGCWMPRTKV